MEQLASYEIYPWIKAFHLIAMTAWMAGMFYLPRLYVYHHGAPIGSAMSEIFKLMEVRLLRIIINPAMIATWVLGLWLIWINGTGTMAGALDFVKSSPWLHGKLTLLVLMQLVHAFLARSRRQFAADRRPYSTRVFRIVNEIPTVLLFGIIILAVVKPFQH